MRITLLLFVCLPLAGQTLSVRATTPNQAAIAVSGTACTFELRENDASGLELTAIAGAAELVDTFEDGATRLYILGKPYGDLSLRTEQLYYLDCGGATAITFRLPPPALGNTYPQPIPWDSTKPNNVDGSTIDWTVAGKNRIYNDWLHGIPFQVLTRTGDFGWKNGPSAFSYQTGCNSWTDPEKLMAGSAANYASTTNENPCDLYVNVPYGAGFNFAFSASDMNWAGQALGVQVFASRSVAGPVAELCVFHHGADPCLGTALTITPGTGAVARVDSGSTDTDKPWPDEFPDAPFRGWGSGATIPRDRYSTNLSGVTCAAGDCSIAEPSLASHFLYAKTGDRIQVSGASAAALCTPANICTIDTYHHAGRVVLIEAVTGSGLTGIHFGWGVRVKPVGAGTLNIGVQFKTAGTTVTNTIAEGFRQGMVEETDGSSNKGYVSFVNAGSAAGWNMWFVPNDALLNPVAIAAFSIPTTAQMAGRAAADRVSSVGAVYPTTTSKRYFASVTYAGGERGIEQLDYTGDFTSTPANYTNYSGGFSVAYPETNESLTWTAKMAPSGAKDLDALVTAYLTTRGITWNATLYGSWNSANFYGVDTTGSYAVFARLYGSQDFAPCWVAFIDLTTNPVSVHSVAHTIDGAPDYTTTGEFRWASCHSFGQARASGTFGIGLLHLAIGSTSVAHTGPHTITPDAIWRSGAWDPANVRMTWPLSHAINTYDKTCPASGVPQWILDLYGGSLPADQCVTLRGRLPLNTYAGPTEIAEIGACVYDGSRTCAYPVAVGDVLVDYTAPSFTPEHSENFRVLAVTDEPGDKKKYVLLRDGWAQNDYFCASTGGGTCVQDTDSMTHNPGFVLRPKVGRLVDGSASGSYLTLAAAGAKTSYPITALLGTGHNQLAPAPNSKLDFMNSTVVKTGITLVDLNSKSGTTAIAFPKWGSQASPLSGVQNYIDKTHGYGGSSEDQQWALNFNALNPGLGLGFAPYLGTSILGARTFTAVGGGCTDVYEIQVLGASLDYKQLPLVGWSSDKLLRDITSSTANICTAANYSLCHEYKDNWCTTDAGTATGKTYVKVANAYNYAYGVTAVHYAEVPTVVTGYVSGGMFRQYRISRPNADGGASRLLSYGMGFPGLHWPYTLAQSTGSGKVALSFTGQHLGGYRASALLYKIPAWSEDTRNRTAYGRSQPPLSVGAVSGATHARIQWGYNSSFYCLGADGTGGWNGAQLACYTDENAAGGYIFSGDTAAATPCAGGCNITVPWIPERMARYRIEWCADAACTSVVRRSRIDVAAP